MKNSTNKAFLLYKDSLTVLDQLTDQQAGKLFKAIVCFQNTGEIGDVDQITKIIITPFLSQFTRDEEKYKNSILQGKLGNLKKYHNDIYLRVVAQELTIEEAESLAYPDKSILGRPPITPDHNRSHSVSDSVSVKDNIKRTMSTSTRKSKINNSQFEEFWNLYDKKVGIAEAKNKFALALSKDSFENIIAGVKKFVATRGIESKFWKHPTTWLNQECWKDEYSTATKTLEVKSQKEIWTEKILKSPKPADYEEVMKVANFEADYKYFENDKFYFLAENEAIKTKCKERVKDIELKLFKLKNNQCQVFIISKNYFDGK